MLLIVHVITTYWRDPGLDAVLTAALTLIPIGLAVSLNATLLQALVQLESPPESEGPVIVVYTTVTTIVAPLGGLLLGAAADLVSLYWALAGCGLAMIIVAVCLHSRFSVFDEIGAAPARSAPAVRRAPLGAGALPRARARAARDRAHAPQPPPPR